MEKYRVFYLDDDRDDIELFLAATENFNNVQVIVFTDSNSMIKNLHLVKKIPNALFVDINMPTISGYDVIKEIRVYDRYSEMPIVILSAMGYGDLDRFRSIGANYFVVKPVTLDKLRRTLRLVFDMDFKAFVAKKDDFVLRDIDTMAS